MDFKATRCSLCAETEQSSPCPVKFATFTLFPQKKLKSIELTSSQQMEVKRRRRRTEQEFISPPSTSNQTYIEPSPTSFSDDICLLLQLHDFPLIRILSFLTPLPDLFAVSSTCQVCVGHFNHSYVVRIRRLIYVVYFFQWGMLKKKKKTVSSLEHSVSLSSTQFRNSSS